MPAADRPTALPAFLTWRRARRLGETFRAVRGGGDTLSPGDRAKHHPVVESPLPAVPYAGKRHAGKEPRCALDGTTGATAAYRRRTVMAAEQISPATAERSSVVEEVVARARESNDSSDQTSGTR